MKTFQKPLTSEEEKIFLSRLHEGDLSAKDILIERNLRLVAYIVKKYQCPEEDREDLISIGTIGLIKAVMTYNEKKGSRLATYAARCIENELLMMFRSKKKIIKDVSLYEPIGTDKEGNEIRLMDVIENQSIDMLDQIDLKDNTKRLYSLLDCLNDREREVIIQRYGLYNQKMKTQREVAARLHISRSYVSRIEKAALNKLENAFYTCQTI